MFHSELPDIRSMINKLNAFDEKANKAIRDGINKGGDIILAEQRRLIGSQKVGKRLSKAIKKSRLTVSTTCSSAVSTMSPAMVSSRQSAKEYGLPGFPCMTESASLAFRAGE